MHFKFTRKSLGIPYAVYLMLFVVAPLLVLFYYAFTNGSGQFTLSNFTGFFTDPNAMGTLFYSFAVAVVTTLVCLLLFGAERFLLPAMAAILLALTLLRGPLVKRGGGRA